LLAQLVPRHRGLPWVDVRSVLEQLTLELQLATDDQTLPAQLRVAQVWVTASGGIQLLDMALEEERDDQLDKGSPAPSATAAPFGLLRQVAAFALESRPRPPELINQPIEAPVPGHASVVLERLMGGTTGAPFMDLAEVRSALAADREQPSEISRPGRALHVLLQGLLLLPGLICMFGLGAVFLGAAFRFCVMGTIAAKSLEQDLEARQQLTRVELVSNPDVRGKVIAAARLQQQEEQLAQVRQKGKEAEEARQVVLKSWSWFAQRGLMPLEDNAQRLLSEPEGGEGETARQPTLDLQRAETILAGPFPLRDPRMITPGPLLLALVVWPVIWCLWSGLTRGGLVLHYSGMAFLGANGRPAARWRCALRSLLIWLPVTLLLVLSLWLDLSRLCPPIASPDEVPLAAWVAWWAWWQAFVLAGVYVWVAIRWPNGGPHDRLAGTFVVPR
jgi:hypothetical protein